MTQEQTQEQEIQYNYLKTRDDADIVKFKADDGGFKLAEGVVSSWGSEDGFDRKVLRHRIEPWLTSLFQSEHISLLAGSGLTHAVHWMAAGSGAASMDAREFSTCNDEIVTAAKASAERAGREGGNIEDQLRAANELLAGLRVLGDGRADQLQADIDSILEAFADSILASEAGIAAAEDAKRDVAMNYLVNFLMSFASRTATRERLHVFTTNYDRLIESGAEIAGLHLLDRFLGNLAPIFRSSRLELDMHYNPPGIRGEPRYLEGVARYTKLHGSVDWVQHGDDIRRIGVPFGAANVAPYLDAPGLRGSTHHNLMIYPNSAKDRETSQYPYVELFRDLAAAACRPNSTLVTYGYSFGDEHINRVIKDMLSIPSAHLVIISIDDPLNRIMKFYDELGRPSQVTLLIGRELGDLKNLVDHYLPKSAIDRTTVRMSELIKSRMGASDDEPQEQAQAGEAGQ